MAISYRLKLSRVEDGVVVCHLELMDEGEVKASSKVRVSADYATALAEVKRVRDKLLVRYDEVSPHALVAKLAQALNTPGQPSGR